MEPQASRATQVTTTPPWSTYGPWRAVLEREALSPAASLRVNLSPGNTGTT